ncbi:hypothetical protein MNBD_ALPHA12-399 [hydrothermal vent metagenome]|uniref:Tripartite ATP-independent periplasmic transporters DctQ component domain-containing protein n=1 Tax=hydrothermal vent metagenome TaxID=652676 RepID=A0A3B0TLF6_9ZZZZ
MIPASPVGRIVEKTASPVETFALYVALLGGVVLIGIAVLTLISVAGRALIGFGLAPLRGQFELVQAGTAFVVTAFMPWAQLKRAHASVAVFTDFLPARANAAIDFIGDALLFALAVLLAWRQFYGVLDKLAYGETSFLLRFPLWWAYGASMIGLLAWIVVGLWCSLNSGAILFSSRTDNKLYQPKR